MSAPNFAAAVAALAAGRAAPHGLALRLEELRVRLASDNAGIVDDLRGYFSPFLDPEPEGPADLALAFLDGPRAEAPAELAIRPHLPGKRPDKERSVDLPAGADGEAGRLVRKQATGMLFAFGERGTNLAVGPCAANRNQLVNFLCARLMERRVAAGWALGHAAGAAVPYGGPAIALCGFAGMGKSTLALHLLARGLDFVSNDRVLVEPRAGQPPLLHGIPKHPRLNPGTALGNPELAPLLACALPRDKRKAYIHLPKQELLAVEDKYDALVDACFPPEPDAGTRFRLAAPLRALAVLNWRHGGGPLLARRVELAERPDLLAAFRKPPGVFYLPAALATARLDETDLLRALSGVRVLELAGGADFPAAAEACLGLVSHNP